MGLQAWHGTEPLSKQDVRSTATTSGSSLRDVLIVTATETESCFLPSSCRQCVTIRAASLTCTWACLDLCTIPGFSTTTHCPGSQSTLLEGILSLQMEGTFASNIRSPSLLPTRGQYKVWASTAIIPGTLYTITERAFGMMKTRFRVIFQQVLQVITACCVLHNICLSAGDIVAPEDEPEKDVAEDEEELVVLSGGTNCLLRCLPWRTYQQNMITFNRQLIHVSGYVLVMWQPSIQPCKPVDGRCIGQ